MRTIRWIVAGLVVSSAGAGLAQTADQDVDQGLHRMTQGDYRQAEPLLRAAVARDPYNAEARFSLASTLRDLGRNQEAVAQYEQAIRLAGPNDGKLASDARYGLALARDAMGDPAAAVQAWSEYLRFASSSSEENGAVVIARERYEAAQRAAGQRTPAAP